MTEANFRNLGAHFSAGQSLNCCFRDAKSVMWKNPMP